MKRSRPLPLLLACALLGFGTLFADSPAVAPARSVVATRPPTLNLNFPRQLLRATAIPARLLATR